MGRFQAQVRRVKAALTGMSIATDILIVPADVKRRQFDPVIQTRRAIGQGRAAERIAYEIDVLVEGVSKKDPGELLARTEWEAMVVFPGDQSRLGHFPRVRFLSVSGSTFRAEGF